MKGEIIPRMEYEMAQRRVRRPNIDGKIRYVEMCKLKENLSRR